MRDLILDPNIRTWVFVPILLLTFLMGVVKHYLSLCLSTDANNATRVPIERLRRRHLLLRCRALRANASQIPKNAYVLRVNHFVNEANQTLQSNGNRKKNRHKQNNNNNDDDCKYDAKPFDPRHYLAAFKTNAINVVPMFVAGTWIVYTYSGFVVTKLPFALTPRFKAMLQRSTSLNAPNEPWVSSASWYFLCVFGMRNVYDAILRSTAERSDDEREFANGGDEHVERMLRREVEELQATRHDWILKELNG